LLQGDPLPARQPMVGGQHHDQGFEPNLLDLKRGVDAPRREQEAEVELPSAKRFKPFIAVEFTQQQLHVGICTSKTGNRLGDHGMGGCAHKAQPKASDLTPTRALSGMNSVSSRVQDSPNVLQKSMASWGECNRSLCANEKLDTDLALEPANFLTEVGLCNAQPRRSASEVKLLGDRHKELESSVFQHRLI